MSEGRALRVAPPIPLPPPPPRRRCTGCSPCHTLLLLSVKIHAMDWNDERLLLLRVLQSTRDCKRFNWAQKSVLSRSLTGGGSLRVCPPRPPRPVCLREAESPPPTGRARAAVGATRDVQCNAPGRGLCGGLGPGLWHTPSLGNGMPSGRCLPRGRPGAENMLIC